MTTAYNNGGSYLIADIKKTCFGVLEIENSCFSFRRGIKILGIIEEGDKLGTLD